MGIENFTRTLPLKKFESLGISEALLKFIYLLKGRAGYYLLSFKERFGEFRTKLQERSENKSILERRAPIQLKRRSFILKPILLIVVIAVVVGGGVRLLRSKVPPGDFEKSEKISVKGASSTTNINKEFSFPLKDSKGKEISNFKYMLEKAELRDEIIVKGKKATAVKGRVFLILTLKITNEYTQSIEVNTKDYVRLSVNGNRDEWLAPDIHNDPVKVQAISTKYTRVGFPINESDKDLVLRVGEINGEKEEINLAF